MTKQLEVKNLNYAIGGRQILNNLSLNVFPNHVLAILGRSGSGKSTLLKIIAGLLQPESGLVKLDDEKVKMPNEQLIAGHPKIKIVRQDNPLFPNISLKENIEYELRFYDEKYRDQRVGYLIKISGLEKVAGQLPREVSEGEQQRAVIAKSLADEPKLLLLDEPFSNLDAGNKARLKAEIQSVIVAENMSCIFVTHDVNDVFGMADSLAILKEGKIIRNGDPKELFQFPASEYEAGLMGAYNKLTREEMINLYPRFKGSKKKYIFKPELIKISESGLLNGEVISCNFKGFFYEIGVKNEFVNLIIYDRMIYHIGSSLKFDLPIQDN